MDIDIVKIKKTKSSLVLILFLLIANFILAQNKFYLGFYAKGESGLPPSAGHAYVLFIKEDDNLKQTVIKEAWGLYPKTSLAGIVSIFGEVPGEIRSDINTYREDGIVIEVSSADYYEALDTKNKWSTKRTYQLINHDCVEFVKDVAKGVYGITLPNDKIISRGLNLLNDFTFPLGYIKYLKFLNTKNLINNSELIPIEYRDICNYENLILKNENDTEIAHDLYKRLLGALTELGHYRLEFIKYGNFINLFPTAYFHTTAKEMINITNH